jgi:four helix bundle protein
LSKEVYSITKRFPKEELYGLTSQMRRAAVSVPTNIAEGAGRYHKKEYTQFLYVARGSVYELMTLMRISQELEFLAAEQAEAVSSLCSEVMAMLNGLIASLE